MLLSAAEFYLGVACGALLVAFISNCVLVAMLRRERQHRPPDATPPTVTPEVRIVVRREPTDLAQWLN
jgi:hypothetical protein